MPNMINPRPPHREILIADEEVEFRLRQGWRFSGHNAKPIVDAVTEDLDEEDVFDDEEGSDDGV